MGNDVKVPRKPKKVSSWSTACHRRCTIARQRIAHPDPRHLAQLPSSEPRLPALHRRGTKSFPGSLSPGTRPCSDSALAEEPSSSRDCRRSMALGAGMEPKSSSGYNYWAQTYCHEWGTHSTGDVTPLPASSPWVNTCLLWGDSRRPIDTVQRAR